MGGLNFGRFFSTRIAKLCMKKTPKIKQNEHNSQFSEKKITKNRKGVFWAPLQNAAVFFRVCATSNTVRGQNKMVAGGWGHPGAVVRPPGIWKWWRHMLLPCKRPYDFGARINYPWIKSKTPDKIGKTFVHAFGSPKNESILSVSRLYVLCQDG